MKPKLSAASAPALGRIGAVCLLIAGVGCSKSRPTAEIIGKVTLNGKPVPNAVISFIAEDGSLASGRITDGEYQVLEAPQGPVKIEIAGGNAGSGKVKMHPSMKRFIPEGQEAAWPPSGDKVAAKDRVIVPARYGKASTSGLSYDVKPGQQTHDINLKP